MTKRQDDLELVMKAMRLTGSKTVGDLVSAFAEHDVQNAKELINKLEEQP